MHRHAIRNRVGNFLVSRSRASIRQVENTDRYILAPLINGERVYLGTYALKECVTRYHIAMRMLRSGNFPSIAALEQEYESTSNY